MLREIEKKYIETYSVWEKYRKIMAMSILIGGIIDVIIFAFNLLCGYIVLFLIMLILIGVGIYARKKDFLNIRKRNKRLAKFKYNDYKMLKFKELKDSLENILKSQNMYNVENLNIIINKFENDNYKYDKLSIISIIVAIMVALLGLNVQKLVFAIAILIAVAIVALVPLILDLSLRYVLVNKVKYEEIVDALIEIQLEIVSLNGNVKNKKVRK